MSTAHQPQDKAALEGGLVVLGRPLLLVDSITEAVRHGADAVVVSGSHGGLSAARFALAARPHAVAFNDAGIGKDGAGIAALAWLQAHGIAAVAVAHDSARIGEALSTWNDGVISAAQRSGHRARRACGRATARMAAIHATRRGLSAG